MSNQSSQPGGKAILGKRVKDWWRGLCALLAIALGLQGAPGHAQTVYYHNDVAGSPLAATDEAGNLLWRESYRPYGERMLKPASANAQWFQGKQLDPDTGLEDFGARNYDPVLGRFLSVDPVDFQEENIHSFNRYAYANNNPYKYVDPDGKYAELAIEAFSLSVGLNSLRENLHAGRYWAAAADGLGVVGDGALALVPGVPGVVGLGVKASREMGEQAAKGLGNQNPLYKAAVQQFKNSDLSNAGRALTKHPELIGETKETLRQSLRTDGAINEAAHSALRDIMRNGATTNPTLGRYGTVTQTQIPGGFGARWAADGSFIGFINP